MSLVELLSPEEVRLRYIEQVCRRAASEHWSLAELTQRLRVHERTVRRYLDQFGLTTALLITTKS